MNKIFKKVMQSLFSHLGLCFLLGTYCALGALMFETLEGGNEFDKVERNVDRAKEIETQRKKMLDDLYALKVCSDRETGEIQKKLRLNETHNLVKIMKEMSRRKCRRDQILPKIHLYLEDYQQNLIQAIKHHAYKGYIPQNLYYKWTYPSALVFTTATITTIGYGHITPKTEWGRLLVIPYAILGIPLTLIFLANIGKLFASGIRIGYTRGLCFFCFKKRNVTEEEYIKDADGRLIRRKSYHETLIRSDPAESEKGPNKKTLSLGVPMDAPVPISFTCGLILLYCFMGAGVFNLMEGWPLLTSLYFSFVTLSTIGFGDYVPGFTSAYSLSGKLKLFTAALYIIVGLSMLSMGFDLIVTELFSKAKAVGRKAGILEEGEETMDAEALKKQGNLGTAALIARKNQMWGKTD